MYGTTFQHGPTWRPTNAPSPDITHLVVEQQRAAASAEQETEGAHNEPVEVVTGEVEQRPQRETRPADEILRVVALVSRSDGQH